MRLLLQKSADANDGSSAHSGRIVNIAIAELGAIEQSGNMPALGERPNFRRGAKVEQKQSHFVAIPRSEQRIAQLICQCGEVAAWRRLGSRCCCHTLHCVKTIERANTAAGVEVNPSRLPSRGRQPNARAMHQFELTDDQLQIQEMARKFTADAITPFAAEWDEKHILPKDSIREAAELGFGAVYVSEESG